MLQKFQRLLAGLFVCSFLLGVQADSVENPDTLSIYILVYGYHTSVVIPTDSMVQQHFSSLKLQLQDYLEFSWGDSVHYQSLTYEASKIIPALGWPTSSVLHVYSTSTPPQQYMSARKIYIRQITQQNLRELLQLIKASFATPSNLQNDYITEGRYLNSGFYEARLSYHALYNCNSWILDLLEAGEVSPPPFFWPFRIFRQ